MRLGQLDDVGGLEIARGRRRRIADEVRLVGELDRQLGAIDGRVHDGGADAALAQAADHAHRDLAAVDDQHLAQFLGGCLGHAHEPC